VPTGALYSVLLVLHVVCAVTGFGTVVVTGVEAARARRGPVAPGADAVRRYFRPGVNWVARSLYGVPVFGLALIGASRGAWRASDGFVVVGLVVWLAATVLAEVVAWPGERRIQSVVSGHWGDVRFSAELDRECRRLASVAALLVVLFVASVVIMVGKP
jgi:uncharacterized membrane protein